MAKSVSNSVTADPTSGRDGRAPAKGEAVATLIEVARRQETLLDALTLAVDSGDTAAILEAARTLTANRRKDDPVPGKKRGNKAHKKRTLKK